MPPRSTDINANLTKGSAQIGETLQLLRLWDPRQESPQEFRHRVVEGNLLGKASRSRASDVLQDVFARRYWPEESAKVARRLRELVAAGTPRAVLDRLLYYHSALAEHLLYRCATELVYDHRTRGVEQVRKADVLRFLRGIKGNGRSPRSYSDSVTDRLAQGLLTALRDFGILEGRTHKRIAPVVVPDEVVGYVVYALKDEGHSAKRIAKHTDWKLFLLHAREVEDRIIDVSGLDYFAYRSAGDIRRFDWRYDSLDEYVGAIAGT